MPNYACALPKPDDRSVIGLLIWKSGFCHLRIPSSIELALDIVIARIRLWFGSVPRRRAHPLAGTEDVGRLSGY